MEIRTLCIRYLSGEATPQETAELEQWLLASSDHTRLFARYALDEFNMQSATGNLQSDFLELDLEFDQAETEANQFLDVLKSLEDHAKDSGIVDLTAELEQRRRRKLERERQRLQLAQSHDASGPTKRVIVIPKAAVWLGLAAAVGLAIWLGLVATSSKPATPPTARHDGQPERPDTTPVVHVAAIKSSVDAQWQGVAPDTEPSLARGVVVSLTHGYAEVVFGDGAAVIVTAPATFEPTGPNGMRLIAGSITATCPESAHLFEVATAAGRIVDLGTEFGVAIDESGATRAQVFSGKVTLTPSADDGERGWAEEDTVNLSAGVAALATTEGRVLSATPDELAYVRNEEYTVRHRVDRGTATGYERWLAYSYELRRDEALIGQLGFDAQGVTVIQGPAASGFDARWVGGEIVPGDPQRGTAAVMKLGDANGNEGVDLSVSTPGGFEQLTLITWVRIDQAPGQEIASLMHRNQRGLPASSPDWQIRFDRRTVVIDQESGLTSEQEAGRNEVRLPFGWQGNWHCLTAVLDSRSGTAHHYLDGESIGVSELLVPGAMMLDKVRLGGIGPVFNDGSPRSPRGELGMFICLDRAMSDDEVRTLFEQSNGLFE